MNRTHGQTLRIALALAWEFSARGWRGILLGPFVALFMPGLIFVAATSQESAQARNITHSVVLMLPCFWIIVLSLGSFIFINLQNSKLRYTLPAPNWLLVAGPMACAMLTMFAQYAIVAMVLNVWLDAGWPILGPGLLAALMIAWCQAVQWSTANSVGLPFLACLASFVGMAFAAARWTPRHGPTMPQFFQAVGGWHLLAFGLATLVCLGVGTVGFTRLRRGSGIDGKRILDWLNKHIHFRSTARATPFPSSSAAQFWLEWNWHGYVLPLGMAVVGITALVVAICVPLGKPDPGAVGRAAGEASVIFVVPLYVIGLFWGNRSPNFEFGAFGGSRPLPDRQIASAILKSATLSLLSAALIWAACLALCVLIVGGPGEIAWLYGKLEQSKIFAARQGTAPLFLLGALAVWSAVGTLTSLALAGRKPMGAAIAVFLGTWSAGFLLHSLLPGDFRDRFSNAYGFGCFVLCILGCWATYVASWRRRLISLPALLSAAAIVSTAIAAVLLAMKVPVPFGAPLLLLCCGCTLLTIPLAAMPLAVYVNRHR